MTRSGLAIVLTVSTFAMSSAVSRAQEVGPGSEYRMRLPTVISSQGMVIFRRAQLLVRERSRAELNLTADQAQRVDQLLADWSESETTDNQTPIGEGPGESDLTRSAIVRQRNEAKARRAEKSLEQLQQILTRQQHKRLNELVLQLLGMNAFFARDPAVGTLKLGESQLAEIRKLRSRSRSRNRESGQRSPQEEFFALLTPQQRTLWDTLVGEPFLPLQSAATQGRAISVRIPQLRPPSSLLKHETVRTALELDDAQQKLIDSALASCAANQLSVNEQILAGADKDELQACLSRLQSAVDEATSQIQSVLSTSQASRLEQLSLQRAGLSAFSRPEVARELNLDDKQTRQITELRDKLRSIMQKRKLAENPDNEEELADTREQLMREALDILSHEQRMKWHELTGDPVVRE